MDEKEKIKKIKNKCHNNSFHSYQRAFINEEKLQKTIKYINLMKALKIIIPLIILAIILGYLIDSGTLKSMIYIALPMSIFQLILSLVSFINKWNNQLDYLNKSAKEYYSISENFKKLGEFPPKTFKELNFEFELINTRFKLRAEEDSKHLSKNCTLKKVLQAA